MSRPISSPPSETARLLSEVAALVGSRQEARWILEEAEAVAGGAEPAGDAGFAQPAGFAERALAMARRRAGGEPLQHVFGHFSFRSIDVLVDGRALVPRPETEVVTEVALSVLEVRARSRRGSQLVAADLGTGSGVIACSLLTETGDDSPLVVHATDASKAALSLAGENARRVLRRSRARALFLHQGSWFGSLPADLDGALDLVVSNPPYVSEEEWAGLPTVVREYDPYEALVAGPTGLEALYRLVDDSPGWLAAGGTLVAELAPHQADACLARAEAAGFERARVERDLAGRRRVLVARRHG